MRYYGFANFMLSSIQQGVQNFHVLGDMLVTYTLGDRRGDTAAYHVLTEWAANHKTAIFLNGGNNESLVGVYNQLYDFGHELHLPFDKFHEDRESLGGVMTACGIVVPSYIVDMATVVRDNPADWTEYNEKYPGPVNLTALEFALFLNQFGLAR